MTIQITDHPDGCVLGVKAQPGSRRNACVGVHGGLLKVAVTAPPDKGKANDGAVEFLADYLNVKRSEVVLVSGATSREKKFLLRGMSASAVAARIKR